MAFFVIPTINCNKTTLNNGKTMKKQARFFLLLALAAASVLPVNAQEEKTTTYTRGIGIYPGNPTEYKGPQLIADRSGKSRNVALMRKCFASSSYDYNLTAQLATDGLVEKEMPAFLNLSSKEGNLKRREREWLFDGKIDSKYSGVKGAKNFLQLDLTNCNPTVTRTSLRGYVLCDAQGKQGYTFTLEGSNDALHWSTLSQEKGEGWPNNSKKEGMEPASANGIYCYFEIAATYSQAAYSHYRFSFDVPSAQVWNFTDWDFWNGDKKVVMTTQQYFKSEWMSLGSGSEWLYVDLGAQAELQNVKLHWMNKAAAGKIQLSDDGNQWRDAASLPGGSVPTDLITLKGSARYVKLLLDHSANGKPYILSEMEVNGTGGLTPQPQASPAPTEARCDLTGGGWMVQRASLVEADGKALSRSGYHSNGWIPATVPGTVLTSFINIGAIPDGNYGDDQLHISDSYFLADFWYRNEFEVPSSYAGKEIFLNFDGINWKANIFVNGTRVGRIEGAFMSGKFDITPLVKTGEKNALAVQIIRNDTYGAVKEKNRESTDQNGGILGADNPTFHASIGWDWIPTVRGRNIGIWNDVYLTANGGGVTLEEPYVTTDLPLPSTDYAIIGSQVKVVNHRNAATKGSVHFSYGDLSTDKEFSIAPLDTLTLSLDSVRMEHPRLWMPVGYGEPNLYPVTFVLKVHGAVADEKHFLSGVREMSYRMNDGALDLYVNGRRFTGYGGNWGFPEVNLNYRGREYDIAVSYHAAMNFNMIRNWVGMTGDEEFYEACDRHGVMIWQDFWLANPWDGPVPDDNAMFMKNARDYMKRIRNHPSIALYVGRNEGYPPEPLNSGLTALVKELAPGMMYIPHSAADGVSGEGPYCIQTPTAYFSNPKGFAKFHSERGMPNVMTAESIRRMLPSSEWWPQTSQWGMHDYTLGSAQKAQLFNDAVEKAFGPSKSLDEFASRAQWFNYEGYRAMFEARSAHRKGLLLWMSHSCWPSMTWDTYDYYYEPTAAFFGCKKGAAPIHIQWNPVSHVVEVVNNCVPGMTGITARMVVMEMNGKTALDKSVTLDSGEDTTLPAFKVGNIDSIAQGEVYFLQLQLSKGDQLLADNFYTLGREEGNLRALNSMEKAPVTHTTTATQEKGEWHFTTTLKNEGNVPALMIRLKAAGERTGESILPVWYSDNYFALIPGETKVIETTLRTEDARGEKPAILVSGFNLK